jgi:DNA mismatch endonuclease, patch repair protein
MAASKRAAPSSPEASRRMQRVRQKNTSAESALRRELLALRLRYRIQVPVLNSPRRVADFAFLGARVAVFVDGCFWHGCPEHATWPKQNAEFWRAKIVANRERDRDTDARLRADGWKVVRVWAHEAPDEAAARIAGVILAQRKAKGCA